MLTGVNYYHCKTTNLPHKHMNNLLKKEKKGSKENQNNNNTKKNNLDYNNNANKEYPSINNAKEQYKQNKNQIIMDFIVSYGMLIIIENNTTILILQIETLGI